jgi:hypothetical protein
MPPLNPAANGQRNNITSALMNIARPPPRPPMAQQMPSAPSMGLPQMSPPGSPPLGAPLPQMPPPNVPLSAGVPVQQPMPQAPVPQAMPQPAMGSAMANPGIATASPGMPAQPNPMQQAMSQTPQGY